MKKFCMIVFASLQNFMLLHVFVVFLIDAQKSNLEFEGKYPYVRVASVLQYE